MKDSKFELVVVAGARAKQLLDGCTPRVEPASKKVKTALREVRSGAVAKLDPPQTVKR
ncbi:MAG TPA: DNA-directed RNA polymerase subunit omega [Vicinamibacterales bacterium]|nr:DNA-directed RNA polymerase subunit omega [Vicinamibacterales bacterium]